MQPTGFWSYARGDDDHLDEMLSTLRQQIAGEISMLMGEDVGIFQDIHDLRTGDDWAEKLRKGVSAASFLIPVLTPRFFNRPWCREEVLTYLRISKEAGLVPRIFPMRFVEWDSEDGCEVRAALEPFQYMDFSHWRFESDPTQKARLINSFAKDVKTRLILPTSKRASKRTAKTKPPELAGSSAAQIDVPQKADPSPPKVKVHIVDPWPKRGDFTSIQAAIDAAEAGDRIVVREGTYREALRLSRVLEIVGEGDRERILVSTEEGNALHCDAPMARISGLRFRREAGGKEYGVWISAGGLEMEDCVIESLSLACIAIEGSGTAPALHRCMVRDGSQGGLYIKGGAQPVAEDCRFMGNSYAGVEVKGRASRATLRRCMARNGKQGGYLFSDGTEGVMESCEAIGNSFTGVEIKSGASPLLRDCSLRENKGSGLHVWGGGSGQVYGGRISGNGKVGIKVKEGGAPEVVGCTITDSEYEAIWIVDAESGGIFRDNDLRDNLGGAWDIAEGAEVERSGNKE